MTAPSDLAATIREALRDVPGLGTDGFAPGPSTIAAMLAQVIADTYLPAIVREAEARALREAADELGGTTNPTDELWRLALRTRADRLDPDAARGERGAGG